MNVGWLSMGAIHCLMITTHTFKDKCVGQGRSMTFRRFGQQSPLRLFFSILQLTLKRALGQKLKQ